MALIQEELRRLTLIQASELLKTPTPPPIAMEPLMSLASLPLGEKCDKV